MSNFETKSEIAHVNFKYASIQAFKCYCMMGLLSPCHRDRLFIFSMGAQSRPLIEKSNRLGRYLDLSRIFWVSWSWCDPMELVHSWSQKLEDRKVVPPLGQRSQFKTKPKQNGKCKAGNGWKQEDKAIKISASGCSL